MSPISEAEGVKLLAESRTYATPDGLTLHYVDYNTGPSKGVPVVCLPGLTRNARDFSALALNLSESRRVLCLDFRGRGSSQWDADATHYQAYQYVADTLLFLQKENLDRVIIVGTSLGGIVGTGIAEVDPGLLAGIVLNDIGPVIDPAGLKRIGSYLGRSNEWPSWKEAAAKLKEVNGVVYPTFTDKEWLDYARKTCRETAEGLVTQDYDPAISQAFASDSAGNVELWEVFDALADVPALLLRGALSDLLSSETAQKMEARLPKLDLAIIADRGHVPTLEEAKALSAIRAFVAKVDALNYPST